MRTNYWLSAAPIQEISSFHEPIWEQTLVGPPPLPHHHPFSECSLSGFASKVLSSEGEAGQAALMGSTEALSLQHCCRTTVLHVSKKNISFWNMLIRSKLIKGGNVFNQDLTFILFNTFLQGQLYPPSKQTFLLMRERCIPMLSLSLSVYVPAFVILFVRFLHEKKKKGLSGRPALMTESTVSATEILLD